jgi:hypothetical protein
MIEGMIGFTIGVVACAVFHFAIKSLEFWRIEREIN